MLIDKTIELLKDKYNLFVIEGSPETSFYTEVLRETGVKTIDGNAGNGSGLDAEKVFKAVKLLEVKDKSILFIENLADARSSEGLTDLGENYCAVVFGVTEGDNKPAKYPELFTGADCCIINKIDLMPYVDFNIEKAKKDILALNAGIKFFEISAKTGEGIDNWVSWITEEYRKISE
jgi:hydrogenase nickel incorporation protein HypB